MLQARWQGLGSLAAGWRTELLEGQRRCFALPFYGVPMLRSKKHNHLTPAVLELCIWFFRFSMLLYSPNSLPDRHVDPATVRIL